MAKRVEATVRKRVEEAMQTQEVQLRTEVRLREERAKLQASTHYDKFTQPATNMHQYTSRYGQAIDTWFMLQPLLAGLLLSPNHHTSLCRCSLGSMPFQAFLPSLDCTALQLVQTDMCSAGAGRQYSTTAIPILQSTAAACLQDLANC